MTLKYSMTIRWSEEDQVYLVWVPEFGTDPMTHGATYEEAARQGSDLIESLIQWRSGDGETLPAPDVYIGDPEEADKPARPEAAAKE